MYNVTIKRETSKYNKYMLWHVSGIAENGARFSMYEKTLQKAIEKYRNNPLYKIIEIIK
jgi:hypothetical protein